MHRAIAATSFDAVARVPAVSLASEPVRRVHDFVLGAVYAGVRAVGQAAFAGAATIERIAIAKRFDETDAELLARTALNAAFGDALAATGNALAIELAWYDEAGRRLGDDDARAHVESADGHVVVFVHGLGCSERSWRRAGSATYAARATRELGASALYLRYNSGLPVDANGLAVAAKLAALEAARVSIVAHSMGGLVARAALAHAHEADHAWLDAVHRVVCLGTPHLGAPLERFGRLAAKGLRMSHVTAPLATIGDARSAGIRDLHDGARARLVPGVAYRFLGSTLAGEHGVAQVIGDGLVPIDSATPKPRGAKVRTARLDGIGHLRLLNDDRVYDRLRAWLAEA